MRQPRSPSERLPEGNGENCKEGRFKHERGEGEERRLVLLEVSGCPTPRMMLPKPKTSRKAPFLNPDPLTHCSGSENIVQLKVNDEASWGLLHSGSTINVVTPEFIKAHSLDVGPLTDLVDSKWV